MGNHRELVKEQLMHMLFGTFIFGVLGGLAVALDLAAGSVQRLGVSLFTQWAIEFSAHVMLAMDLVLFALYLARSGWSLAKETFK